MHHQRKTLALSLKREIGRKEEQSDKNEYSKKWGAAGGIFLGKVDRCMESYG